MPRTKGAKDKEERPLKNDLRGKRFGAYTVIDKTRTNSNRIQYWLCLSDMGERPSPKHSLDRWPDNNGNYEPANCRWATMKEQSINRRTTVFLIYKGVKLNLKEWAEIFGIHYSSISRRLKNHSTENVLKYFETKTGITL